MNNTQIVFTIITMLLLGTLAYGQSKIERTEDGFVLTDVKTYLESRIIWGDGYGDHDENSSVHNTEVIAFGDGWEYSTTTDDDGYFKVQVKPDVPFKIKASDGNQWNTVIKDLDPIPYGTVGKR